ncbi:uncharacterized protein G2W53_004251 [Senna tora]|uniref:Uncharacterized protein n=1 Tax=Senna tora TaxID=362788 RepID=A0A834XCJ5_9FABA|nr:uncharacterized protein G2W53_004251 [Senna tora]
MNSDVVAVRANSSSIVSNASASQSSSLFSLSIEVAALPSTRFFLDLGPTIFCHMTLLPTIVALPFKSFIIKITLRFILVLPLDSSTSLPPFSLPWLLDQRASLKPWIIILFILVSPIGAVGSNSKISRQIDFTLWKYWAIVISRCVVDNNALSRSCNRVSFFLEKRAASVSQLPSIFRRFGITNMLQASNTSSSINVLRSNIAFPALIFHFRKVPFPSSASGCTVLMSLTTSQSSWPCI